MSDLDELQSELTDSLKPQGELRPLCLQAAEAIARLRGALDRCIVDLEAARLLIQHTMGEPHGLNQTLAIARAALSPAHQANPPTD